MRLRIIFTFLRTWPLYICLIHKTKILKDEFACRWYQDVKTLKDSRFFYVLSTRRYYRDLLYFRLRLPSSICIPIFGGENLAISKIDIGGGCHLEHPHGTHINAIVIGKNFKCFHCAENIIKSTGECWAIMSPLVVERVS